MFRLIIALSTFAVFFGACSDKLPTAQQAVAQTKPGSSTDDTGEAIGRNPEKHDIYPRPESEGVSADEGSSSEESEDDGLDGVVNLNNATSEQLQMLDGIGSVTAGRILEYREKRRFEKPVHIKRVRGIGDATFRKLKAHLRVSGETTVGN